MRRLVFLLFLAVPHLQAAAQTPMPSQDSLTEISERGRLLAAYDVASWNATEAVMALGPDYSSVTHYIPRKTADGWLVAFGRLNATADTFLIVYLAKASAGSESFTASALGTHQGDVGYFLKAARAIDLARDDFGWPPERPYNVTAIPAAGSRWWVYLLPAQTQRDVWVHGADWRYYVSSDGLTILERRQFHKAIIEYPASSGGEARDFGWHTELLADIVADTDVYLAVMRRPSTQELVVTESFIYTVEPDGSISCVYKTEGQ